MLVWAQNRLKSFLVITTGGEITTLSLQLKRRGFRVMMSPMSYTLTFILIIAEGVRFGIKQSLSTGRFLKMLNIGATRATGAGPKP